MAIRWIAAIENFREAFDRERARAARDQPEWMLARLDYLGCRRFAADPDTTIDQLAAAIGMPVPAALRTLWAEHGAFSVMAPEVWGSVRLYSAAELLEERRERPHWPSVYDGLCRFANRSEFEEGLTMAEADALRSSVFLFGHITRSDSDFELLVFSGDGTIGGVRYDHEWRDFNGAAWHAEYASLATGRPREIDLDAVLAEHIRLAQAKMLRWNSN